MRKKGIVILLVVLGFCLISNISFVKQIWMATVGHGRMETEPVVVIDAGHGGMDPGKIGVNQVLEKDMSTFIRLVPSEIFTLPLPNNFISGFDSKRVGLNRSRR